MSRALLRAATTFAVACGTAGILNAQTAQTSPNQPRATGSATPVTYQGCLQPGSALAGSRTLTPGASTTNTPPLSGYILTNARPSDASSPANQPPPGQSSSTTSPPATPPSTAPMTPPAQGGTASNAGAMYHIVGLQDDELQKLSNQQVEVRGVIETTDATAAKGVTGERGRPTTSQPATPANPATGTAGTTEAVGTSSGANAAAAGQPGTVASTVPSFRATSIRVLSTTCSAGTN
jgi:hypothetical protein